MKDGFTRKKVESLTLGEKLKKMRGDFRMSLTEVSKATRIQVKYLEYLENSQYEKLPADVYVRGFLRSYARYLNIDEQAFVKLYESERNIQTNLGRDVENKNFHAKHFHVSSFVITPRTVVLALIFLLVGGAFFYLFREFQSFAGTPRLVISNPANGATLETSDVVVTGKTDRGARVSINNQSVFVGSEGEFSDKLILQPGLNTITVVSINRFNKEKSETLSVEARYSASTSDVSPEEVQNVQPKGTFYLDISVREMSVKISVEVDGTVVFSGMVQPGEVQKMEAKEGIKVTSDNPSDTFVRFNGAEETVLGGAKKTTQTVLFTVLGKQE